MDFIELPQYPNVAAGAPAALVTDDLLGRTVLGLVFEQGGTTFAKADMENIRVTVAGKDLVDTIAGDKLERVNAYNGMPDVSNFVTHWFGDPTSRTIRGQWLGALDLSVYQSQLEIEVAIAAGAVAPTLKTWAIVGAPKESFGVFSKAETAIARAMIRTFIQPPGAVSRTAYQIGLGSEAGARIRALHFFHANLTKVEFRKQSDIKHDDVPIAVNDYLQQQFARVPAAGHYVLDRIIDGNQGEAENTLKPDGKPWPFQVKLTTSAADNIDVFADVHTALPLI